MAKKFEDIVTGFDRIHERDRRTADGRTGRHRMTAQAALMHSIARRGNTVLLSRVYGRREPITTVSLAANTYCMMDGHSSSAPRTVGPRVQFSGACEQSH